VQGAEAARASDESHGDRISCRWFSFGENRTDGVLNVTKRIKRSGFRGKPRIPAIGASIGISRPGKKYPEPWDRDLDVDLECIRDWGAEAVVTV
jgi:hypothetical protein